MVCLVVERAHLKRVNYAFSTCSWIGWRFGLLVCDLHVGLNRRNYSTPRTISTGMGDRGWGSTPRAGRSISVYISHPGQLSLAIPPWVNAMSTSQKALMLCGWGVKAGMVR